jgi:hypothetical protein
VVRCHEAPALSVELGYSHKLTRRDLGVIGDRVQIDSLRTTRAKPRASAAARSGGSIRA